MSHGHEDHSSHIKEYWWVFAALMFFTGLTVAVWGWFDFGRPGFSAGDCVVGLLIACVKASLVGLIFMHLREERGLIYKILVFTFYFFAALMFLCLFALSDPIRPVFGLNL
ncbi:MAG: cytochrome C oxidase subunit IV family protein [Verrucomicrobiales bacterium]|nr:cytochrome C oxidase subunit IV family protein [Verrucomicrobiae bacterium]MCP5554448.1 cytochrome C oxidase subunit IV family protein [Akkermansiaceae bacterium]HRX54884.1 cytochrome C oxidase subunit IV family protein [Verrucomicrobiales bacterium]